MTGESVVMMNDMKSPGKWEIMVARFSGPLPWSSIGQKNLSVEQTTLFNTRFLLIKEKLTQGKIGNPKIKFSTDSRVLFAFPGASDDASSL